MLIYMLIYYANLFMDKLENNIIHDYYKKTGQQPMLWMRYIDDIFFIWTHDDKSLNNFLKFADEYTHLNGMKSKIKFETNISKESVNFLDVTISITKNKLFQQVFITNLHMHIFISMPSLAILLMLSVTYLKDSL